MAAWTYDEALRRLLAHEGGYTNHPSDPGGPTNFGITIYDYRKYIKRNATAADVRAMTVGEAKAIYRKRYWDSQRCDERWA
ncbi:MAG: glycosyl hydrolase 108 family protein [Pseudolabrys sp.]